MKLYNLEEHNSQQKRHVSTPAHNVHYAVAKSLKDSLEKRPKLPGTYWKIVAASTGLEASEALKKRNVVRANTSVAVVVLLIILASCGSTKKPHCPTYAQTIPERRINFVAPIEEQTNSRDSTARPHHPAVGKLAAVVSVYLLIQAFNEY